jgi:hypothetical protein
MKFDKNFMKIIFFIIIYRIVKQPKPTNTLTKEKNNGLT